MCAGAGRGDLFFQAATESVGHREVARGQLRTPGSPLAATVSCTSLSDLWSVRCDLGLVTRQRGRAEEVARPLAISRWAGATSLGNHAEAAPTCLRSAPTPCSHLPAESKRGRRVAPLSSFPPQGLPLPTPAKTARAVLQWRVKSLLL